MEFFSRHLDIQSKCSLPYWLSRALLFTCSSGAFNMTPSALGNVEKNSFPWVHFLDEGILVSAMLCKHYIAQKQLILFNGCAVHW